MSDLDLTAATEAAAEKLSVDATGFWHYNGEDVRDRYRQLAALALAAAAPHIEAAARKAALQEAARGLNATAEAYRGRYGPNKWDCGFVDGIGHAASMVANSIDRPEVLTEAARIAEGGNT